MQDSTDAKAIGLSSSELLKTTCIHLNDYCFLRFCIFLSRLHRELVQKFFCNASRMLRPDGEIHVSHKTSYPFYDWDIEELADWSALRLVDQAVFNKACYPGYMNKRGEGSRCDQTFPIGESSTYKFQIVLGRNFRSKRRRKLRRRLNTCWENYFLLRRYLYSF